MTEFGKQIFMDNLWLLNIIKSLSLLWFGGKFYKWSKLIIFGNQGIKINQDLYLCDILQHAVMPWSKNIGYFNRIPHLSTGQNLIIMMQ
jgi:hypothetical protein